MIYSFSMSESNRISCGTLKSLNTHSFLKDRLNAIPKVIYTSVGCIQRNDKYIRLKTLVHYVSLDLYYNLFHNPQYGGFPTKKTELYKSLKKFENKLRHSQETSITENDWVKLFPENKKSNSLEFTIELFQFLIKNCVSRFPEIANVENNVKFEANTYMMLIEKLHDTVSNPKLVQTVNSSHDTFVSLWNILHEILLKLNYDVNLIKDFESGDMDKLTSCRHSLLTIQLQVLLDECKELDKSTSMNGLAVSKLISDYNETISKQENGFSDDQFSIKAKSLQDNITLVMQLLSLIKSSISELTSDIPFWRENNIEGDIIIYEEKLSKLRNQINEQTRELGEIFHSTSLDIVKIKERLHFQEDNIHVIHRQRSTSSQSLKDTVS
ncbi:uncharacterized protein LOC100212135 isoform X3 [Hydra vulgaris]|uniref:Uncharacterized protein LOC100212135 isoform X3 n=2 Tax=Hydra vulgaris TaxID=6087 RepID=A0ABM4B608_HYDVU